MYAHAEHVIVVSENKLKPVKTRIASHSDFKTTTLYHRYNSAKFCCATTFHNESTATNNMKLININFQTK